ncbi:unnamed protein product, partial [Polarella glacialis]
PRRWHLAIHLGRWVDKEVTFSPGGGSVSNFDFRAMNFRVFQEIPWRPHFGSDAGIGQEDLQNDGELLERHVGDEGEEGEEDDIVVEEDEFGEQEVEVGEDGEGVQEEEEVDEADEEDEQEDEEQDLEEDRSQEELLFELRQVEVASRDVLPQQRLLVDLRRQSDAEQPVHTESDDSRLRTGAAETTLTTSGPRTQNDASQGALGMESVADGTASGAEGAAEQEPEPEVPSPESEEEEGPSLGEASSDASARSWVRARFLLRHSQIWGGRLAAADAAAAVGAATGWADGRHPELLRPRFLRPPLAHLGRRFPQAALPFLMPLTLPLTAVPLPFPRQVPVLDRRRRKWRHRQPSSFSLIRVPSLPFLLRVGRTSDWGWSLTPVGGCSAGDDGQNQGFRDRGHIGRALCLESRQLSALEHEHARETPPETFTLYLRASSERCRRSGLDGCWECFESFQGTMRAPTWSGSFVTFEFDADSNGDDTITSSAGDDPPGAEDDGNQAAPLAGVCHMVLGKKGSHAVNLTCRARHDVKNHTEGQLDLYVGQMDQGQPCYWSRGGRHGFPRQQPEGQVGPETKDTEASRNELPLLVLVLTMGMFFGSGSGPPPLGIPTGLPSLEEVATSVSERTCLNRVSL